MSQPLEPLPQFVRRLESPSPPDIRHDFPAFPVASVNKPQFVLLFPHIRPKPVYFKTIAPGLFWFYRVGIRFEGFQDLGDADPQNGAGIPNANSPDKRDLYHVFNP
jgi:hypothetical protein